jgi:hypothetical protein
MKTVKELSVGRKWFIRFLLIFFFFWSFGSLNGDADRMLKAAVQSLAVQPGSSTLHTTPVQATPEAALSPAQPASLDERVPLAAPAPAHAALHAAVTAAFKPTLEPAPVCILVSNGKQQKGKKKEKRTGGEQRKKWNEQNVNLPFQLLFFSFLFFFFFFLFLLSLSPPPPPFFLCV